jgi:cobalt-precorrin 5A hydrolase
MGGGKTMSRVIAGLGFRRDIAAADLLAMVAQAAAQAGRRVDALAVPDFKAGEAAHEAARALAVPLILVERAALLGAQGRCLTRSETARQATGLASVAEACALAAAGERGQLLLARIAGARATCALAEEFS